MSSLSSRFSNIVCDVSDSDSESGYISYLPNRRILKTPPPSHIPQDSWYSQRILRTPPPLPPLGEPSKKKLREDDWLQNEAKRRRRREEVASCVSDETDSCCGRSRSSSQHSFKKQGKRKQWMTGMSCRAIYEQDGLEYEAFVVRILNHRNCIVKFLGYNSTQQVAMETMKPSLGEEAQQRQIEQAFLERGEECDASANIDNMQSHQRQIPENTKRYHERDPRINRQPQANNFHLPEDLPMPDMDKLRNMTSIDISFPMPPPLQLPSRSDLANEDDAASNMLLAWYISGYYTGLYQGLRSKVNKRHKA